MILFPCLQWTVACSLVEQKVMSPCVREGVGDIITGACKTIQTNVLDTSNNQMMITTPSKGMTIGAPTTGKMAEVEEGNFPEEEEEGDALVEGAEDASPILSIPTNNKTLSKEVEMARQQMPQTKLLLYPNHHLLQVISLVGEEVLEVVVEVVAVEGLSMEEEVGQVEQRWRK